MAVSIGLKVFSVLLSLQLLSLFATCRKKTQGFQQHFGPVHCPFIQKLSTKNKIKAGWNLSKGIFVKNLDQILKKTGKNYFLQILSRFLLKNLYPDIPYFFLDKTWIKSRYNQTNQRWTGLLGFREPILPLVRFWWYGSCATIKTFFALKCDAGVEARLIHTWNKKKIDVIFWTLSSVNPIHLMEGHLWSPLLRVDQSAFLSATWKHFRWQTWKKIWVYSTLYFIYNFRP